MVALLVLVQGWNELECVELSLFMNWYSELLAFIKSQSRHSYDMSAQVGRATERARGKASVAPMHGDVATVSGEGSSVLLSNTLKGFSKVFAVPPCSHI